MQSVGCSIGHGQAVCRHLLPLRAKSVFGKDWTDCRPLAAVDDLNSGHVAIQLYVASAGRDEEGTFVEISRGQARDVFLLEFLGGFSRSGVSERAVMQDFQRWTSSSSTPMNMDDAGLSEDCKQIVADMVAARSFQGLGRSFRFHSMGQKEADCMRSLEENGLVARDISSEDSWLLTSKAASSLKASEPKLFEDVEPKNGRFLIPEGERQAPGSTASVCTAPWHATGR